METQTEFLNLNEIIGEPTDISLIKSGESISKISFDLYKETAGLVILVSNLYETYLKKMERNQAITAGLLVRIGKFMASVMALVCDQNKEHGEVIIALNRCISETIINLRYLSEIAEESDFDKFVKSSLRPEKEAYKKIKENIIERGEELPIETRMLSSIVRLFESSGVDIEDAERISKWLDYKSILRKLGIEAWYEFLQGIPSHLIHGTWVDVRMHHLKESDGMFETNFSSIEVDARLLCPVSVEILRALKSYLNKFFSKSREELSAVFDRIEDLTNRIREVERCHEQNLA